MVSAKIQTVSKSSLKNTSFEKILKFARGVVKCICSPWIIKIYTICLFYQFLYLNNFSNILTRLELLTGIFNFFDENDLTTSTGSCVGERTQLVHSLTDISHIVDHWLNLMRDQTQGPRHQYNGKTQHVVWPAKRQLSAERRLSAIMTRRRWFLPGHSKWRRRADPTLRQARPLGNDNKIQISSHVQVYNHRHGKGGDTPRRELPRPLRCRPEICWNCVGAKTRPCSNMPDGWYIKRSFIYYLRIYFTKITYYVAY